LQGGGFPPDNPVVIGLPTVLATASSLGDEEKRAFWMKGQSMEFLEATPLLAVQRFQPGGQIARKPTGLSAAPMQSQIYGLFASEVRHRTIAIANEPAQTGLKTRKQRPLLSFEATKVMARLPNKRNS